MDWRDIKEFFKDTFKYIIVVVAVLIVAIYILSFQQVVGPSMQKTLYEGDIILLSKAHYHFFEVKRGEIISFEYADTKYLIKRVVGLPGEKIEFKDNVLYINDVAMQENYIVDNYTDDFSIKDLGYDVIPENMYLMLGDNRKDSLDSREIGLVSKEKFIGKVIFRFWPLGEMKVMK